MSRVQGPIERALIGIADTHNVQIDEVLKNISYANDVKLECVRLFQSNNLRLERESLKNCVNKYHAANVMIVDLTNRINN